MMNTAREEQLDKFIAELWLAMTRIVRNARPGDSRLAEEHELTQPQLHVLWQLRENQPMTMGELSESLAVTHGVATRMVDRLLSKGMVERRRDESDRRIVIISLTALGERVAAEVIEDAMAIFRGAFKNVQQRDRDEFLALLGRIEEARSGVRSTDSKDGG